jgi:hypothetical protein
VADQPRWQTWQTIAILSVVVAAVVFLLVYATVTLWPF